VGERGERGGGRKRDKKDAIYLTPVTYWGGGGGGERNLETIRTANKF